MNLMRTLTTDVVSKAMDGYAARQKALASNIANAETPGYQRRDVLFQDELAQAVQSARSGGSSPSLVSPHGDLQLQGQLPQHYGVLLALPASSGAALLGANPYASQAVAGVSLTPTQEEASHYRNDDNGVDIEHEMVDLSKNSSKYKSLATLEGRLNQQLKGLLNNIQ